MADRATERRWLEQLIRTPTAPGREHRVLDWARVWAGRRPDLRVTADECGNLLVTQKGRRSGAPVVAVAHTDHPGFVVTAVQGRRAEVEFRGGVRPEYFADARIEFFDVDDEPWKGRLDEFDHDRSAGTVLLDRSGGLVPGDIGRWSFRSRGGTGEGQIAGPACDDLAGAAAALAALDRARGRPELRHFSVLLTRAEEVGFVGAIGACRSGTLDRGSRVLSIECSRAFSDSPLGDGPVVRVGDATSVFDHELTNRLADVIRSAGIRHQRKLMAGGSCEATAFVAYGYRATGLCLPLGNYHNMGNLDEVEAGSGSATPRPEVVDLSDFHGLVDVLLAAAGGLEGGSDLVERLDRRFAAESRLL